MIQFDLAKILQDSRTTLDQILAQDNKDKKGQPDSFDPLKVKINPELKDSLDQAIRTIDTVVSNTKKTHERNQ